MLVARGPTRPAPRPPGGGGPRPGAGLWPAAVGLVALAVVLPGLTAVATHSFGIARNDDWSYLRTLHLLAQRGRLDSNGWSTASLVGQLAWSLPFVAVLGDRPAVADLSVAALGVVAVVAALVLARAETTGPRATWAVLLTVAVPGFALNTTSYMSDVPGFAAAVACLALGTAGLRRSGPARGWWLAGAVVVGLIGVSIREFDLGAPLAVLAAAAWADRARWRRWALAAALTTLAAGALSAWAMGTPGVRRPAFGPPDLQRLGTLGAAAFTTCLALAPLLPARLGPALRRRPVLSALGAATGAGLGVLLALTGTVIVGNYLTPLGATGNALLGGLRPALLPAPVWDGVQGAAVAAGAMAAGVGVEALAGRLGAGGAPARAGAAPVGRSGDAPGGAAGGGVTAPFAALMALELAGYALLIRTGFFDRYLWPLVLALAVVLLRPPGAAGARAGGAHTGTARAGGAWAGRAWAAGASVALVLLSAVVTVNADAFDGATWRAGTTLEAGGVPARAIDAGFDWVGYHQPGRARPLRQVPGAPPWATWYGEMFPGFAPCRVATASPEAGLRPLGTLRWDLLGVAVPERLWLYAVTGAPCGGASRR